MKPAPLPPINFITDFDSMHSICGAAQATYAALAARGLRLYKTSITGDFGRLPRAFYEGPYLNFGRDQALNIFYGDNSHAFAALPPQAQAYYTQGRYTIGFIVWETPEFPAFWQQPFQAFDAYWVPSDYVRQNAQVHIQAPVYTIPHIVEVPPDIQADRARFSLPADRYIFLFIFNVYSTFARKNPEAIIQAFEQAFRGWKNPPLLVMKVNQVNNVPKAKAYLQTQLARVGGVLLTESLSRDDLYRLIASCDAYISLHRAEGFGLSLAEAMALGKPTIGTAFSGNLQFMNPENSYLIPAQIRPIREGDHWLFPEDIRNFPIGAHWAEPDIAQAAQAMHDLARHPEEGQAVGQQARAHMQAHFSSQALGQMMEQHLSDLITAHQLERTPIELIPPPPRYWQAEDGLEFISILHGFASMSIVSRQMADGFLAADIPLQFSTVYYETQAPQSPLPEEFLHYQQKNRPIPQPGLQMALYVNLLFEPPNYAHLAQALTGRYKIFYLVCELDRLFERDLGLLSLADEIWTASEFCARTYRRYTSKPVYMIPHSIVVPPISGTRADFGLPEEGFLFLFSFAALSLEARKNARGLIQAFEMAFGPEPGKVKLIIKTLGLQAHDSALAEELRAALDQLGGIWIDEDYSNAQNWALMAACDAYISLHRAEGFGLTLAEAMALGKPVIATAYSGNLDFMTPENSYLVDYTLRPLQPEEIRQYRYVSSETPHWAEPDLAHAAEIMRQVVENPQAAQIKARRGQETIQQELNPASLQAKMLARLEQIPMNRPHQLLTDEIQQGQHERELAFHARVALFKLNQAYQAWHRIRMSAEALPQFLTKLNILAFPYRLWQRVRILGKLWAAQSDYDETLEQHLQALQITVYHLQDEVRVLQHELDHLKAEGRKKHD